VSPRDLIIGGVYEMNFIFDILLQLSLFLTLFMAYKLPERKVGWAELDSVMYTRCVMFSIILGIELHFWGILQ
jgi:hypothetical protein